LTTFATTAKRPLAFFPYKIKSTNPSLGLRSKIMLSTFPGFAVSKISTLVT